MTHIPPALLFKYFHFSYDVDGYLTLTALIPLLFWMTLTTSQLHEHFEHFQCFTLMSALNGVWDPL